MLTGEPSGQSLLHATVIPAQSGLLDLRAATLNQNCKYYNNQHTGYNPDNQGAIHIDSSFLR
jgi:hypothetical protein